MFTFFFPPPFTFQSSSLHFTLRTPYFRGKPSIHIPLPSLVHISSSHNSSAHSLLKANCLTLHLPLKRPQASTMNSGYRDPEKLKAAQELANSFKHGGGGGGGGTGARSSGTYGGVKSKHSGISGDRSLLTNAQEHQKKPNASTKSLHSTPAMSANGVPNVSMRNYPSAGNFVPRESNHSKTKGPALMGNALDFLKHQDAANPPRPCESSHLNHHHPRIS